MTSTVHNVTVDCRNAYQLAEFWSEVLDLPLQDDDEPGDDEVLLILPTGTWLLFQQVPEPTCPQAITSFTLAGHESCQGESTDDLHRAVHAHLAQAERQGTGEL